MTNAAKAKNIKQYGFIALIFTLCIFAFIFATKSKTIILQGEVDSHRIDLALRVSGRVQDLHVDVGDQVKPGDKLLTLSSPQLEAQLATAVATLAIAQADKKRVYSTRSEVVNAAKATFAREQTNLHLAQQSYSRFEALVGKGGISQQSYDQSSSNYQDALKRLDVAKANLDLAENGSSTEEKALADAKVIQSKAMLDQIKTDIKELSLTSPIPGRIVLRVAEIGQLFNAGTPVFSIINMDDTWFTFNVREDMLSGLKIGDPFIVKVPALNNQKVETKVTAINPLGQYANWRATKATSDFDLKTFEVRTRALKPIDGLSSGMTAIASWK